mgnify:CR=1 FL=1
MQLDPYGVDPEQLTPTQIKDMRARARAIMGDDRWGIDEQAENEGEAIRLMAGYAKKIPWWKLTS